MADLGYSPAPTVGIAPEAPSDYQRNVGSAALQSVSQFGDALSNTADFYSKAALDDQTNQAEQRKNELLYGGSGPGAQPGYLTLNGKQAMDASVGVEGTFDQFLKEAGSGFQSDQQKAEWAARSAALKDDFSRTVGSHADSETQTWVTTVNQTSAKLAQDRIAADPTNPKALASGFADLLNAYTKNAELAGASKGDPVWSAAVRSAQKDALIAQVSSLGATDPSRALNIVQKNRDLLGTDYQQVYSGLRTAAIDTYSDGFAKQQYDTYVNDNGSPVRPAGQPPGQPAWTDAYLANIKGNESGGNPNAKSTTSSATGLYQFTSGTWQGMMQTHPELGLTPDGRTDPVQQEKAVRAFTADNAKVLTQNRVPVTPGSLYLSAFMGAQGAVHLYDTPASTPMEQAVSAQVLNANAWLKGKTVGDVRQWAANIAGKGIDTSAGGVGGPAPAAAAPVDVGHPDNVAQAPVAVPPATQVAAPQEPGPLTTDATNPAGMASAKADMVQGVMDAPKPADMSDRDWADAQKQTIAKISQRLQYEQIAADQTAAQRKAQNDTAMNGYVTKMLTPGADLTGLQASIAQDQNLTGETKLSLSNALLAHADNTVSGATAAYGPGYWDAFKRGLLPPGDPNRLSDPTDILRMASPGPNGEAPALTLAGAAKLQSEVTTAKKSTDASAVQKAKASLEEYAKTKLSNQRDANPLLNDPGHKDPVGEAAFNSTFIPKFEAGFDAAMARGDDVWKTYLTKQNVDQMMEGVRDPQEVAMQKILGGLPAQPEIPAPQGIDQDNWNMIVSRVPVSDNGTPVMLGNGAAVTPAGWAQRIQLLASKPTPDMVTAFDAAFPMGPRANDVLDALGIERRPAPAAPSAPAASPTPAQPVNPLDLIPPPM